MDDTSVEETLATKVLKVQAAYTVKVVLRGEEGLRAPTNGAVEAAVKAAVGALADGSTITASAERVDR